MEAGQFNKGAPGIDGVTVEDWPDHAREHWPALREQIEQGRYWPQAVRRVEIPKPDGGKRLLGIPTVTDRVVQQAIAQVLTPIFDPTFSESSFGFRPGRNAHQAIRQVQATVKDGRRIAVDLDLAKFFDTVNHDVLMNLLRRNIADKRLLCLIGSYLRAGAEPGHKASSGRLVPGEGLGLWPSAACKAWSVSTLNPATLVDGVLRHQPVLQPNARTRRLDSKANTNVSVGNIGAGCARRSGTWWL